MVKIRRDKQQGPLPPRTSTLAVNTCKAFSKTQIWGGGVSWAEMEPEAGTGKLQACFWPSSFQEETPHACVVLFFFEERPSVQEAR